VIASADEDVAGVQIFGDRLHLRIREGSSRQVISRMKKSARGNEVAIQEIQLVDPQLEDVFIALLET
jgi:hypothetical protein